MCLCYDVVLISNVCLFHEKWGRCVLPRFIQNPKVWVPKVWPKLHSLPNLFQDFSFNSSILNIALNIVLVSILFSHSMYSALFPASHSPLMSSNNLTFDLLCQAFFSFPWILFFTFAFVCGCVLFVHIVLPNYSFAIWYFLSDFFPSSFIGTLGYF